MTPRPAGGRSRTVGPLGILVGVVLVALFWLGLGAGRVGAHTDLLQGSPGPGQRVGGTVDFIDLVFLGPVTEVVVEVRGPDGVLIDGEMEVADGQIIRHRMDSLDDPGRYVVDYQMISEDGDLTNAGYFFVYETGAFEPTRLGRVDLPDESLFTVRNVVGALVVAALAGICFLQLWRFRQSRDALAALAQGRKDDR